ncbi:MAG: hypothetical protein P8J33_15180 [Pirellulaceae bacterium]|nr:hypothetical protein [Pirellulaceae bacterium]
MRTNVRLQEHFYALGRRIMRWRQTAGMGGETGVSIGVTSMGAKSGPSSVAFNLAAAIADLGQKNVLFVEPLYHSMCLSRKVRRPSFGFSELLSSEQVSADCIRKTTLENLYLLPCGALPGKSALTLPVDALDSLLPEMAGDFDYIIFDLPTATESTLCFPIVERLDGVVFVEQPRLDQQTFAQAVKRMRALDCAVIGLVLNNT